jgi:hypothetical protein
MIIKRRLACRESRLIFDNVLPNPSVLVFKKRRGSREKRVFGVSREGSVSVNVAG